MKKYSLIINISVFFAIIYWFFIKPQFDSKKLTLAGEVISIKEMKRSGDHEIELQENTKTKYFYYTFFNDHFDIQIGDSVFKNLDSDLFVKSKMDGILRLAKDQKILIGE